LQERASCPPLYVCSPGAHPKSGSNSLTFYRPKVPYQSESNALSLKVPPLGRIAESSNLNPNFLHTQNEYHNRKAMSPTREDSTSWNWLRAGNREAFERFYQDHSAALERFLRRSLGDPKAAEDITQEAFLQLWQRPNGFDPERGSPRTYLFGIAAKRAADWWRRRPSEIPQRPAHPDRQRNLFLLLADALERVDPEKRTLLWLREVEGYSYQELAEILAIPVGTVRSRLFAAREQLRRVWEGRRNSEDQ
jgi:RNA polymerase sigma-70 factor, ECF subfamily